VREAIRSQINLEVLLATPQFLAAPEATAVSTLSKRVLEVDAGVLARSCDADSPQGLVAIATWPPPHPAPRYDGGTWHVALDGLQDPGNVGALARVAEAAGAASLVLFPGTARASHPRALRASAGSLLRLPAVRLDPDDLAARTAVPWIGLDPHRGDDLYEADWPASAILLAGAEGSGVSTAAARHVARWLRIPTSPAVESLNVATAVASSCAAAFAPEHPSLPGLQRFHQSRHELVQIGHDTIVRHREDRRSGVLVHRHDRGRPLHPD
jgi:RNA methyltransferase, TrmH family